MHELIEELQQYHKEKAAHLFDLEMCANEYSIADTPVKCAEVIQPMFVQFQCKEEVAHHHNEELILSELLTTSAPIHRRVEEMSADHKAFDRIIADISTKIASRAASCAELCSDIRRFVEVYKDHAAGEEAIFFPIADEYLEDSHWRRIRIAWK